MWRARRASGTTMAVKGRLSKTVGPLLIGAGNLMTDNMENTEVLNFSVSVFHWQVSFLSSWEQRERPWQSLKKWSAIHSQWDRARAHFSQVEIQNSTGTDEMYLRVLREAGCWHCESCLYHLHVNQGKLLMTGEREVSQPSSRQSRRMIQWNYRLVSLTWHLG